MANTLFDILPEDLRVSLFDLCSIKDIANASRWVTCNQIVPRTVRDHSFKILIWNYRVCKSWNIAISSERLWSHLIRRDYATADPTTLEAALKISPSSSRQAYVRLTQKHTCLRCKKQYSDGKNTQSSCNFHSGVLFSGGLMNGAGLRFVCCNRRAHHILINSDSNGCRSSYHVASAHSLWTPEGSLTAALRTMPPMSEEKRAQGTLQHHGHGNTATYPFAVAKYTHQPVVWDPTQRPGLIELPSRLLLAEA